MDKDTYYTIKKSSEGIQFKDRHSKFFGFAYPIISEKEIKPLLESLKKRHYSARHWCYAYQIGTENLRYRANDDGEPNNSAGMPIYGQIQSYELTNVLIVVVRYYGGVKLGVGGLINAYKTAAKNAINASEIISKTIDQNFRLKFDYKDMSKVMRILKEKDAEIINQKLEENCLLEISVRKGIALNVFEHFTQFFGVQITEL
ncbi:MAG: YigZ family protein [Winogradskyella sp.]|uniref:IMPACT family protein n=1 Tax=Winogradskyella sp. TaxID=1883156 RepID=UPI0025DF4105|nr:YigZ family protein [Winogradskyella sp.]NRB83372.1 YigZ family protein [Winogradskyella sp.]